MIYYLFDNPVPVPHSEYLIVGVEPTSKVCYAIREAAYCGDSFLDLKKALPVRPLMQVRAERGDEVPSIAELDKACKKAMEMIKPYLPKKKL